MDAVKNFFIKSDRLLGATLRCVCVLSMAGIFVLYILNVFIRFMPVTNLTVTDEIVEMLTGWVIFFGAAELQREGKHFALDFLVKKIENRFLGKLIRIFVYFISMVFICVVLYYGFDLYNRSLSVSTTLRIPKRMFYVCVPLSAILMGIYMTRDAVKIILSFRGLKGKLTS
ncbi:MAG: TRAP transporter small permease [Spirochaetia bacterium]|jgi:TRAP-type C4-dicarboxylate transport system permease small subunit|nr:TRAP transporter small permease [Spirochaetia bacterium]